MKVLFLDVDGVLSSFGLRGLCGTRLDLFASIVKQTGAEVVLSSTWRHPQCRDQRMRLQQELGKRGVEFFGMTPRGATRGQEIGAWLDEAKRRHEISAFAILDDDPNNEMGELHHALVKCDGYQGLTEEIAQEVVRKLNLWTQFNSDPVRFIGIDFAKREKDVVYHREYLGIPPAPVTFECSECGKDTPSYLRYGKTNCCTGCGSCA